MPCIPMHSCTDQALNLCMSRESYRTSKSKLGNWSCKLHILEFHVSSPVLDWNRIKLESHVKSYPTSQFCRFESFTAQKHSPRLLSQGLLRHFFGGLLEFFVGEGEGKGEVWHLPGLTRLVSWWQFYVLACIQRVDTMGQALQPCMTHDHAKTCKNTTLATGFTVQAPASQNWTSLENKRRQNEWTDTNDAKGCKPNQNCHSTSTFSKSIVFSILHLGQTGDSHAFKRAP